MIYQVQIREWADATDPDKSPVAEYMVGAANLEQAIERASTRFHSEHPGKNIKDYFVHAHKA